MTLDVLRSRQSHCRWSTLPGARGILENWRMVATQVTGGNIDVDQSALTGESLPVTLRGGDAAQMGATVVRGEVHATGVCSLFIRFKSMSRVVFD